MKSAVFAVSALAAAVSAQNLDKCQQDCINSMNTQEAQGLGCEANQFNCLCTKQDYIFGIRDCTAQACNNGDQVTAALKDAQRVCGENGVPINIDGIATAAGAPTPTEGGAGESVATVFSTFSSGGSLTSTPLVTTTLGASSSADVVTTVVSATTSRGFAAQVTAAPAAGMLAAAGIAAMMI